MDKFVIVFVLLWKGDIEYERHWTDRSQYLAARAYFDQLLGKATSPPGREPPSYVVWSEQQHDAVRDFVRSQYKVRRPGR